MRREREQGLMLTIPKWGLWMMFLASIAGTYLLWQQIRSTNGH